MKYYTADTHFYHKGALLFGNRPYETVAEMNEGLISNWNSIVKPTDHVYILGDFIMRKDGRLANELLQRLKGKKTLIVGNHDKFIKSPTFNPSLLEEITPYLRISDKDKIVILSHYPILVWDQQHRGSIHLHGHIHAVPYETPKNAYNVGVDVRDWKPVTLRSLFE